jgi:hypothetical protein
MYCQLTIFIVGIIVVILFCVVLPKIDSNDPSPIEFNITGALITEFKLTSNNTLFYKFKVNITVRNPNKNNNHKEFYKMTTAISSYKNQEFGWGTVHPFVLGSMNTISLKPVKFEGHSVIKLEPEQVVEYKIESRLGFYNLSLELETTSPSRRCSDLIVPLISKGEIVPPFNVTQCL